MNHFKKKIKRLVVLLIRPSKYDHDYLLQWERGSLPSNSLAVMNALTEAAFLGPQLARINFKEVFVYDELVRSGRVNSRYLMKQHASEDTIVVVGLVGVQTNMFPRACDLAREFIKAGATVVIGGFHVSGSITMLHDDKHPVGSCPHKEPYNCELMPPECADIMREGVIIFHGEAEDMWPAVLTDICSGTQKALYRGGRPNIMKAPLPSYPPNYFDGFFAKLLTMDSGRGCPFDCSFCSIINVQGHDMRFRTVEAIELWIRDICTTDVRTFWFFTDDNFCRNPYWEDILLSCTKLKTEGLDFQFMIQSDLAAWRLKGKQTKRPFVELLAEAGCTQVFLGVESVRQDALQQTGKPQNQVATYKHMVDLYHRVGIACHASYIIGFPSDTPNTIAEDVLTLQNIGFDQASFFMLCPIPGSQDHAKMHAAGKWMDPDFNRYDSFQPSMRHPIMSHQDWQQAYNDAWRVFYTKEHLVSRLSIVNPNHYWGLMRSYLWYRWSALHENVHPMLGGFYRRRRFKDRRPGLKKESHIRFWIDELHRHTKYIGSLIREYYFFQDIYFQTRWMPTVRIAQSTWFSRTFGQATHRAWLNSFWRNYVQLKWRLILPHKFYLHALMLCYAFSEFWYCVRFNIAIIKAKF